MFDLETFILSISLLIIISIVLARWTNNTGFPYLVLFLAIGMLAGSEGFGGIYFDNAEVAKNIGVMALVLILFSGGLDTSWRKVKPTALPAFTLATFGVLATAFLLAAFVHLVLNINFLQALLLGSVVASTDAAAVFSILGGRSLSLKSRVKYLLELESGSNDPMAIFLTVSTLQLLTIPETSMWELVLMFALQMCLGLASGVFAGKLLAWFINRIKFPIEGFYQVFVLAVALFIYAGTTLINGSGFLAVYVAGIIVSNSQIVYRRSIFRFFDGLAWLSQIVMFLTLGLLVFPSRLIDIVPQGLLISACLILLARPVSVFLSLLPFRFNLKESLFISWVGLRGAVPIILATFPLLAGLPEASWIFNIVFFIVLTSAVLQGWTIPLAARWLKLADREQARIKSPIEFSGDEETNMSIVNVTVPENPDIMNKPLVELPVLKGSLVVLILRKGKYLVPSGGTILEPGDYVQILTEKEHIGSVKEFFSRKRVAP